MKRNYIHLLSGLLLSTLLFGCAQPSNKPEESKKVIYGYDDPEGTFVLNEGSAFQENGSLIYITPKHEIKPNIYKEINRRDAGNVTQDMAFWNEYAYIISKNEKENTDGRLTVVETKTLKKVANYSTELSSLVEPSHLAVLDDHNIFIRDNSGISRFDRTTKKLTPISGTEGARSKTMAIKNGKVFAAKNSSLIVLSANSNDVTASIELEQPISGIIDAGDNKLYVSACASDYDLIYLIDAKNYSIIAKKRIDKPESVTTGYDAREYISTSYIAAKGDMIYTTFGSLTLYRYSFSKGTIEKVVDINSINPDHKIIYNGPAIHPVTGHLFLNSLKDFGPDFAFNTIYEFDINTTPAKLVHRYDNYTRFPAGIFFPSRK